MPAKRAVLVGCNYPGTNAALRGCINDVIGMKALLTEFYGFAESDILIMIDTDKSTLQPTGKNIKEKLGELVHNAQPGDMIVFHFSGHGTQIPSQNNDERDGKDEAICPTDMNVICDDDLRAILKPLEQKPGVKFTFVADCCHSGTMLDHSEVMISGPKDGAPPPPALDAGSIMGFLASLGDQGSGGRDFKNRSLPFNDLCGMLSQLLGGQQVDARNVRASMGSVFGADASQKIQQAMAIYQQFTSGTKGAGGQDPVSGLLSLLCSCIQPSVNQAGGQQAHGTGNPGYSGPAAGNLAEPNLNIQLPPPGTKPPPEAQLANDVGILITGCQSTETSADACPSGNPNKAHGALSNAIQTIVRNHHTQQPGAPLTYRNLVIGVRELLAKTGFAQNPCLECDDKLADTPFIVA